MAIIEKKVWPDFFKLIKSGKKNVEWRLADFGLKEGDILILKEWDPKSKKYTGRELRRSVKFVTKIDPTKFYSIESIKKFGIYLIEFGD